MCSKTQEAPGKLINAIQRAHGGLKDDTSVIVLDLLHPEGPHDFPSVAGKGRPGAGAAGGCGCACFARCALPLLPLLPSAQGAAVLCMQGTALVQAL
jgi:hypothetical protein